jgi:hypothetical protein
MGAGWQRKVKKEIQKELNKEDYYKCSHKFLVKSAHCHKNIFRIKGCKKNKPGVFLLIKICPVASVNKFSLIFLSVLT